MEENELKFKLENFEGPMDLLLTLVKEKKMDIHDIDLSKLASEYLKLIDKLKTKNIDLASEYLVIASTLIQIKAKLILNNPEEEKSIEKDKQELLKQLIEYQKFKEISKSLKDKEEQRRDFFIKKTHDYANFKQEEDPSKLSGSSDMIKLIMSLRKMFERVNANRLRQTTIEKFNLSPATRRLQLIELFKQKNPTFEEIFSVPTLNHFVVTMLTILDMARKQEVILIQEEQFGDIKIRKGVINE